MQKNRTRLVFGRETKKRCERVQDQQEAAAAETQQRLLFISDFWKLDKLAEFWNLELSWPGSLQDWPLKWPIDNHDEGSSILDSPADGFLRWRRRFNFSTPEKWKLWNFCFAGPGRQLDPDFGERRKVLEGKFAFHKSGRYCLFKRLLVWSQAFEGNFIDWENTLIRSGCHKNEACWDCWQWKFAPGILWIIGSWSIGVDQSSGGTSPIFWAWAFI